MPFHDDRPLQPYPWVAHEDKVKPKKRRKAMMVKSRAFFELFMLNGFVLVSEGGQSRKAWLFPFRLD